MIKNISNIVLTLIIILANMLLPIVSYSQTPHGFTYQAGYGTYAAQLCANSNHGGFADWYLPSTNELFLMYSLLGPGNTYNGKFTKDVYWSSTDSGVAYSEAIVFNVSSGTGSAGSQLEIGKNTLCAVRAIRAF
jgi:hypothetical protein